MAIEILTDILGDLFNPGISDSFSKRISRRTLRKLEKSENKEMPYKGGTLKLYEGQAILTVGEEKAYYLLPSRRLNCISGPAD